MGCNCHKHLITPLLGKLAQIILKFIIRLTKTNKTKSEFDPKPIYDEVEINNIVIKLSKFQGWLVERKPKNRTGQLRYIENIISIGFSISMNLWHKQ